MRAGRPGSSGVRSAAGGAQAATRAPFAGCARRARACAISRMARPPGGEDWGDGEEAGAAGIGPPSASHQVADEPASSTGGDESSEDDFENVMMSLVAKLSIDKEEQQDPPVRVLHTFDLEGIAKKIREGEVRNVIVLTGAGISTGAGIPDFRSPGSGLYSKLADFGLPHPEAIFELDFFRKNPRPFYRLAKELFPGGDYRPTPSHHFVRLLHDKGVLLRCFTQNIDSLETQAGLPRDKLVAAHGNFDTATCIANGKRVPIERLKRAILHSGENGEGKGEGKEGWKALEQEYGGLCKPDIVFFGENLPSRFFHLIKQDFPQCDLLIVMGTSLVVQPFASLIAQVGLDCPRLLINREPAGVVSKVGASLGLHSEGFRFDEGDNWRDVFFRGDCDEGVTELSERIGWGDEFHRLCQQAKA